ncbi:MAG: T9SS type A sorting domain-containing protein, partial [Bacteroidetes bacterium]|nr:T9SS type A sorting domain-containing protein [Bacteroidota bacterium]
TADAGCDSLVITTLTVNPVYNTVVDVAISEGSDYTLADGNTVSDAGTYIVTVQAVTGCDSTVTVNLTVNPSYLITNYEFICDGDSLFAEGAWQHVTGLYYDSLVAAAGGDSIVITDLTVVMPQFETVDVELCNNDSLFVGGAWQTTAGAYDDLYTNMYGCDSTKTTNLSFVDTLIAMVYTEICSGDSIFLGGAWQNTSGVYYDLLIADAGCDSIVETTLTVNAPLATVLDETICQGTDYMLADGSTVSSPGSYHVTIQSVDGCDSLISVNLSVNPVYHDTDYVFVCEGDSIFVGGSWQNTTGLYEDIVTAATGCDSVIITDLTLVYPQTNYVDTTICGSDSIFIGDTWQNASGLYFYVFNDIYGCDSAVYTTLTAVPAANPGESASDTTCSIDNKIDLFDLLGGTPDTTGTWTDDDATGALTGDLFNATLVTVDSWYHFTYTVAATSPCEDASATISVYVDVCGGIATAKEMFVSIYPNPGNGLITLNIRGANQSVIPVEVKDVAGKLLFSTQLDGVGASYTRQLDLTHLAEGVYFLELQVNGMRNTYRLVIL